MFEAPFLSIIVPAYNEARVIGSTLRAMRAYLDEQPYTYEIIVAADGNDGTRELVAKMAEDDPYLRVMGSIERGGKGRGIRRAVAHARGEIIGFVDADAKTPIDEIEKLLPCFDEGYDMVFGSRLARGAKVERYQCWYRRIGSWGFKVCMHLIVGLWHVGDTQCGFKFLRRAAARDLFRRLRIDGYMFDVDLLYLARHSGYKMREVGIRWRDDGDSRLALVSGNWQNMKDLFRIRFAKFPLATLEQPEQVQTREHCHSA